MDFQLRVTNGFLEWEPPLAFEMMKYFTIIVVFLMCLGQLYAQPSPQTKKITETFFPELDFPIVTPAFKKKNGFTKHEEMVAFLDSLEKANPSLMTISTIGTSQKGKSIVKVILTNKRNNTPKTKVWFQGGLHGDEPASTEGLLYLMYEILSNKSRQAILDELEICIVPMANVDGYEKQDRYAANGLDLNRDQTKLAVQESVFLKQAFSDFDAQVAVDFHEYRPYRKDFVLFSESGICSRFDVMLLYSGNLNIPENLRKFTETTFISAVRDTLSANNFVFHDYFTTQKYLGDIHVDQGSTAARSSATNYALTNAVSALIEVRGVGIGRTSFKRRIKTTYLIAQSFLETTLANQQNIEAEIATAIKQQNEAVVKANRKISNEKIKVIDLATSTEIELEFTVHNANQQTPEVVRPRPVAYILAPSQFVLAQKLRTLGLNVDSVTTASTIDIEKYLVTEYSQSNEKMEGIFTQKVKVDIQATSYQLEAGSFVIYTNQRKGNLAIETLEPDAPNSFIFFDVLHTAQGEELPIYRYMNPITPIKL